MQKLSLANLPTKIERLNALSKSLSKNIFIKRDDQTGLEFSGNKIRKLEYAFQQAIDIGADVIITAGGLQSNHARATAALGAKLAIDIVLVLDGQGETEAQGNYLLDKLFGADIRVVDLAARAVSIDQVMREVSQEYLAEGRKPYCIPVGASNGIGTLGYIDAFSEIRSQQKSFGINFDTIVCPIGSGGTYAGLLFGNARHKTAKRVVAFSVSQSTQAFTDKIQKLALEVSDYGQAVALDIKDIDINDQYIGRGYAQSRPEEIDFIKYFARSEGILLDPTYTGKAMYGLVQEIKKGSFTEAKNVLFIHTGGVFGLFAKNDFF